VARLVKLTLSERKPRGEQRYSSTLSLTSAPDRGGWLTPRLGRFNPRKDPVPIVQGAGWAHGPVWTGAENLAPNGIRFPDRAARSESLYRLRYSKGQAIPVQALKVVKLSALRADRLYPPGNIPGTHFC
jgi:hypothetical protein